MRLIATLITVLRGKRASLRNITDINPMREGGLSAQQYASLSPKGVRGDGAHTAGCTGTYSRERGIYTRVYLPGRLERHIYHRVYLPGRLERPIHSLGRHPGGYIPLFTLREAPWWVYTTVLPLGRHPGGYIQPFTP